MTAPELAADIARLAALAAAETDPTALRVEAEMILEAAAELWKLSMSMAPPSPPGAPPNDTAH